MLRHFVNHRWWYIVAAVSVLMAAPITLKLHSLESIKGVRVCRDKPVWNRE